MECLLFQPHPHKKKIPAECWRAKKIICKRILGKKNFIVNQGVEKKFHDQTKMGKIKPYMNLPRVISCEFAQGESFFPR